MTAFFVATVNVKNPDKYRQYAQKASTTFTAHGGELVLRGTVDGALVGMASHQAIGIVKFPSPQALTAWFESPEYQSIVPLRDEAADISIVTYSMPA